MTDHSTRAATGGNAPNEPLYGAMAREVRDQLRTFVVPLHIAEDIARQVLAKVDAIDYGKASVYDLAAHIGALQQSLRSLLASIDAEEDRA